MNNYIFSHSEELSIEVLATSILAKKTNIEMCNSLACVAHINSMNQNSIKKKVLHDSDDSPRPIANLHFVQEVIANFMNQIRLIAS